MSILIQDMEMPKEMRTLTIFPNGYVAVYNSFDTFIGETKAIQIPPHGRVIDADKLETDTAYDMELDDYIGYSIRQIRNAPTIIPADKEE